MITDRTPTPLKSLLDRLGWSRPYAATRIGCSASAVRYWAEGKNSRGAPCPAPDDVVDYLTRCARMLDIVVPPAGRLPGRSSRERERL